MNTQFLPHDDWRSLTLLPMKSCCSSNLEWVATTPRGWIDSLLNESSDDDSSSTVDTSTSSTNFAGGAAPTLEDEIQDPSKTQSSDLITNLSDLGIKSVPENFATDEAIWRLDLIDTSFGELAEEVQGWIVALESKRNFNRVLSRYEPIRDHFSSSLVAGFLNDENDCDKVETMCLNVIAKLKGLCQLCDKVAQVEMKMEDGRTTPDQGVASIPSTPQSVNRRGKVPSTPKQDELDRYMSQWLADNWVNPFPDDSTVHSIAISHEVDYDKVANWLINNRSRKWRKVIQKAFDLGRPAELLMEDSLRMFLKEPLRPIERNFNCDEDDDELYQHQQQRPTKRVRRF